MGTIAAKSISRAAAAEDTRARIIEAGERVFGVEGFAGASMRAIAEQAEVAQGLLHYHFETKQKLYGDIVGWRAGMINAERQRLLAALPNNAELFDILKVLFAPALGPAGGGEGYSRIMAQLMNNNPLSDTLLREHYDPTAQIFIDAIMQQTGSDRTAAAWGYNLAIHVLAAGMARTQRTERLAGEADAANADAFLTRLVTFAAGGIERLAVQET